MGASVPKRRASRWPLRALLLLACFSQGGCYYLQAARGQLELTTAREPIAHLIADEGTPAQLRERLRLVAAAREFAHRELLLPDNGSYRDYVALSRDYVVVNVFAAPEFSLEPMHWCYPFVGCLAYRGYFDGRDAAAYASRLARRGYDVATAGVPAYSTLGRLRDPVVSTMLTRGDDALVALLFHELSHQLFYVDDDTAFNESFASFVAAEGLRRWREKYRLAGDAPIDAARLQRRRALQQAVSAARQQLETLYASALADDAKRERKRDVFAALAEAWQSAGATTPAPANNAALLPLAIYNDFTPAFAALLDGCAGDLACLYEQARALAALDAEARRGELQRLAAG